MRQTSHPIIGRAAELEALIGALDGAAAGSTQFVVVEGEAGIGKTRLIDEMLLSTRARKFRIHHVEADELERDRPFGGIAKALGFPESKDPKLHELAQLLWGDPAKEKSALAAAGPQVRWRFTEAVLDYLEGMAAYTPLLLVVENLHWTDPSTVLVIHLLVRRFAYLPMALIATTRPTPSTAESQALIEEISTRGHYLRLHPLQAEALLELARMLVGVTPGPSLREAIAKAGGNPLFVTELIGALKQEGAIYIRDGMAQVSSTELSTELRLTILRRLRFLAKEELDALRLAAILGSSFSLIDLELIAGKPAVELAGILQGPLEAGVVVGSGERLAFRHELVRDAIYYDTPPAVRTALHADTARVLAKAGARATDVATHLTLGAVSGDLEAVEWLHRAAREAAPRSPSLAVELLQRAIDLTGETSHRTRLLQDKVVALVWSGRLSEAEALGQQLLAEGLDAESEGEIRLFLNRALLMQGRMADALDHVVSAISNQRLPLKARARLLAEGAFDKVYIGDFKGSLTMAEAAAEAGRRANDAFSLCLAATARAQVKTYGGYLQEALQDAKDALVIADSDNSEELHQRAPYVWIGLVFAYSDHLKQAEEILQRGRILAEESGAMWIASFYHYWLGRRRFHAGEWTDAEAEFSADIALAEEIGSATATMSASYLACMAVHRDDLVGAKAALDAAERLLPPQLTLDTVGYPTAWLMWSRGLFLEAQGTLEEAASSLRKSSDYFEALCWPLLHLHVDVDLVRLALTINDMDTARRAVRRVGEVARRAGTATASGAALRARGMLKGNPKSLLASVAAYRQGPQPVELAFACEEAAVALARDGRLPEAQPLLQEAVGIYEKVGAIRDASRAEAHLRSFGVRRGSRGQRRRPQTGWDALTQTEQRVARLVAEGLTNREIGARLFISRRTVDAHMTHILTKLGVSSRVKLAADAIRRDRLDTR